MANRVRIRARGLAALLTSYKIKQSTGKQGSIKKAKEQLDKERNAQNNLEDKA